MTTTTVTRGGGTNTRTLLLAHTYEPLKVISWQRAFVLLSLGKVEVVEEYESDVRTVSIVFKVPAVVRLIRAFRRHKKPVKFSRVNIYARDKYRCQYCSTKAPIAELTYDHVLPRSKGGKTTWTNIVTACLPCNLRKGSRTPQQANMKLKVKPVQPSWVPAVSIRISTRSVPDAWRDYLYWTGALGER